MNPTNHFYIFLFFMVRLIPCHLIQNIVSDLNFQKLNTLNYHNHSFNEILNLDEVYIIEYIHKGKDHQNIMHTLVVDGVGENVCHSNYGVVQYKDLNVNNYYFLHLVSIYGVHIKKL